MKQQWNLLILFCLANVVFAQGDSSLEIDEIHYGELHLRGFKLDENRSIEIGAVGCGYEGRSRRSKYRSRSSDQSNMFIYGWILDCLLYTSPSPRDPE